eukprot:149336_1
MSSSTNNWILWENKYKDVSRYVSLYGTITFDGAKKFHLIKLFLFISCYMLLIYLTTDTYPKFNKLCFIKLIIYSMFCESIGVGCACGPLGGQFGRNKFPLFMHNISIGTCKRPTFEILSKIRGIVDILLYIVYLLMLIYLFFFVSNITNIDDIHHCWSLLLIFILQTYFYIFDRAIFLSSRCEYYGQYLLCIYFAQGWFTACQLLQISVWFWAGFSKMGLWFHYVYAPMVASSPYIKLIFGENYVDKVKSLYRDWPNDLRPSDTSKVFSYFGVVLEIGAAIFMIIPNVYARFIGISFALLLHLFIIANCPLGAVQEWNTCNILFAIYLFNFSEKSNSLQINQMDYRLQIILITTLILIPLIANIFPDRVDFLLGFRYYAGNWEQGTWIINKKQWDNKIVPNLVTINPIYSDEYNKNSKSLWKLYETMTFGFRILSTPTGKSVLNLLKKLICEHSDEIGYKLNINDYMILDESYVGCMIYGWQWVVNEYTLDSVKSVLYEKSLSNKIDKYDIMVIYVKAIPTVTFCSIQSFNWKIFDLNHNVIDQGIFTMEEIHTQPHFVKKKKKINK